LDGTKKEGKKKKKDLARGLKKGTDQKEKRVKTASNQKINGRRRGCAGKAKKKRSQQGREQGTMYFHQPKKKKKNIADRDLEDTPGTTKRKATNHTKKKKGKKTGPLREKRTGVKIYTKE